MGFSSPPTCQLRQGGTNDVVNQQIKEKKMKFKKIEIDENSYIKYLENGVFEIHTSVSGPLGAEVYFFERGLLQGRQRRSYSFVTQIYKVKYETE